MSKSTVTKTVQEFMIKANRPYALNDVLEKCGKELGKAAVQKSLEALVDKEVLIAKTYGKHKIYFAKQRAQSTDLKKDVQLLKQKLAQAKQISQSKENQLSELNIKLRSQSKIKSLATLEDEKEQLLDDIRQLNEKLRQHEAQEKEVNISPQDIKKIQNNYDSVTTAYRKRKRICNDMLEAIMEGYPKPKKALISDIGLETDEEVGFKV